MVPRKRASDGRALSAADPDVWLVGPDAWVCTRLHSFALVSVYFLMPGGLSEPGRAFSRESWSLEVQVHGLPVKGSLSAYDRRLGLGLDLDDHYQQVVVTRSGGFRVTDVPNDGPV